MSIDQSPDERSALERRAQELLQAQAERLDGRTRSRLKRARNSALDALQERKSAAHAWLLPASGAAAVALTVLLTMNFVRQPAELVAQPTDIAPLDGFEAELAIVTAEDSLEFYRDVEFYAWLDTVLDEEASDAGGV